MIEAKQTNVEHKTLLQDGYAIHYYMSGVKTKDLIVFLHPAFADHRCFDKQLDFFSDRFRILTIDLLGHGLSKPGKSKDKIDYSVNHIDEILQIEGYDKAHFVGVSMGTLIAQYYAFKFPAKVKTMTVVGGYDIHANNKMINKAQRSENIKWMFKALFSMDNFRKYVAKISVQKPENQIEFYQMASCFTRRSFLVMSGLGNILKERKGIVQNYPMLITVGMSDLELVKNVGKEWALNTSNCKFSIIEHAGHCANMDNPDEFNKIVMDFISRENYPQ